MSNLFLVASEDPSRGTCGELGGRTKAGAPCGRPAGWGLGEKAGRCVNHGVSLTIRTVRQGERPPPAFLSPESSEIWRQVTTAYVFAVEGFPILEVALTALDRARQARREIEKGGLLFVNEATGTPHANPMLRVERDAQKEFRLAWKQLDLDISPPEE